VLVPVAAVSRIADQETLAGVARTAPPDARRAAAERLGAQQGLLAELAVSDDDDAVRGAAIEGIQDQRVLAEVAKSQSEGWLASAACKKIADATLLLDVIAQAEHAEARYSALEALPDDSAKAQIAKEGEDEALAGSAAWHLTDQTHLSDVARNARSAAVREVAILKLEDPGALSDIAERADEDEQLRDAARRRLPRVALAPLRQTASQDELVAQAEDSPSPEVRLAACRFITDRQLLSKLAADAQDQAVRRAAEQELSAFTNSVGMRMLPVPGRAYALAAFPVTNAQFKAWRQEHDSSRPLPTCEERSIRMDAEHANRPTHPVVCVSRADAVEFCAWLSQRDGVEYRLPTMDEWQHAMEADRPDWWIAREGENLSIGERYRHDLVWTWTSGTRGEEAALPNAWGFYDMLGNVFVWVSDEPPTADEMHRHRRAEVQQRNLVGPGATEYVNRGVIRDEYWVYAGVGWMDHEALFWPERHKGFGPWRHYFRFGGSHGFSREDEVGLRPVCELPERR